MFLCIHNLQLLLFSSVVFYSVTFRFAMLAHFVYQGERCKLIGVFFLLGQKNGIKKSTKLVHDNELPSQTSATQQSLGFKQQKYYVHLLYYVFFKILKNVQVCRRFYPRLTLVKCIWLCTRFSYLLHRHLLLCSRRLYILLCRAES